MSEHRLWELSMKQPMSLGMHGTSGAIFCLGKIILELKSYFEVPAADHFLKDSTVG